MPSSIEMSAPRQATMSENDQIHAENIRQYEAEMVEYNSSCFRKTAHNLGTAACVVGGLDAVVGLPVMLNKASCLVSLALWGHVFAAWLVTLGVKLQIILNTLLIQTTGSLTTTTTVIQVEVFLPLRLSSNKSAGKFSVCNMLVT